MRKSVGRADVYSTASSLISWRSKPVRNKLKKRPACLSRPTLLWIDDYKPGLEVFRAMFESQGFKVLTAASGEEGLKLAALTSLDAVVTDYEMPGMNGEAVAAALKAMYPTIPVVLFSGSDLVSARTRRIFDAVCDKAGSREQLSSTIFRVLHKKPSRTLQPPPIAQASDERRRTVA